MLTLKAALVLILLVELVMLYPLVNSPFRKVGGLYHWRIGRLGGSFYLARRR